MAMRVICRYRRERARSHRDYVGSMTDLRTAVNTFFRQHEKKVKKFSFSEVEKENCTCMWVTGVTGVIVGAVDSVTGVTGVIVGAVGAVLQVLQVLQSGQWGSCTAGQWDSVAVVQCDKKEPIAR